MTKPSDIQTERPYYSTFGMWEMEHAARLIVRYLQLHGDAWTPINRSEFDAWAESQPEMQHKSSPPMKVILRLSLSELQHYEWLAFDQSLANFVMHPEFVVRLEKHQLKAAEELHDAS